MSAADQNLVAASPEQVAAQQDALLRAMLHRIADRHPYYRDLFRDRGLDITGIRGVADLPLLPVTSKTDFTSAPDRFRLEPDGDPESRLWDIAYTSGSTSAPVPIYQAAYDFHAILLAQRRMAEIRGMTRDDRIANLYPLTPQPHGAWTRANQAAAALGASVVCGMSGASSWFDVTRRLTEVAELVVRTAPTVLWGVPSYLRRVVDEVINRGERLESVRMLAVSGESCPPELAELLTRTLERAGSPGIVVSNSLGASELQCGLVECVPGSGFHNPAPELFHLDALTDDGRPAGPGARGQLAITHLDRRGTVLLRYLLGDVVTVDHDPCPYCGRCGGRVVAHHGRGGRLVKVRGQLFDPQVLEQAVAAVPGVLEHRTVLTRQDSADPLSGDRLVIHLAVADGVGPGIAADVQAAVKAAVRVTPEINLARIDTIHSAEERLKPHRFVDERATPEGTR